LNTALNGIYCSILNTRGSIQWVKDLNHFYRKEPALFEKIFLRKGLNLSILVIIKIALLVLCVNLLTGKVWYWLYVILPLNMEELPHRRA